MHNKKYLCLVLTLMVGMTVMAQEEATDSVVIDRTVYVEREFQPTVEAAGKIAVKPQVYEPQLVLQDPVYSDYSNPLSMDYNVRQLDFSTLNFRHPDPMHGFMRAGLGHVNSLFQFNYRVTDSQMQKKKKQSANDMILDLYVDHRGQWGKKTLSESVFGIDFSKTFNSLELFFGAKGGNDYYTHYGAYYDAAVEDLSIKKFSEIDAEHRRMTWNADAHVGIKSAPGAEISYMLRTGYEGFIVPQYAIEHEIHTVGSFEWEKNYHTAGMEMNIQNRFFSVEDPSAAAAKVNHHLHFEPFYAYTHRRFRIHAGVNLDFSAGRGRVAGISPNVRFEADLTQNWLALYANVTGFYEANGARGEYKENRYLGMDCIFTDTLSGAYQPVNVELGFKVRPYATLLLDIHAGYSLTLDEHVNVFAMEKYGYFHHASMNSSCWKVGGDLHYHFRDVISLNVGGNYFARKALTEIGGLEEDFDAPSWEVHLRLEGKINQKWSVYSDNYLMGSRNACVYDGATSSYSAVEMRPMYDLNLGVQYNVNRWLSIYAQLNNYLAWTNKLSYMTYYGYEAQRANCMFGLSWSF